jgi:hypothetical protein
MVDNKNRITNFMLNRYVKEYAFFQQSGAFSGARNAFILMNWARLWSNAVVV